MLALLPLLFLADGPPPDPPPPPEIASGWPPRESVWMPDVRAAHAALAGLPPTFAPAFRQRPLTPDKPIRP